MARLQIQLDARLTAAHKRALVAYWHAERRLTHDEKRLAFEGLDWLKQSVIQTETYFLTAARTCHLPHDFYIRTYESDSSAHID